MGGWEVETLIMTSWMFTACLVAVVQRYTSIKKGMTKEMKPYHT